MSFLELHHLKYRYPHAEALALDGISLRAEKGSFIGIAGACGSGRSTLCYALAGLVPQLFRGAYGGQVLIDGQNAARIPVSRLCKTVGLVFQNPFNQLSGAAETVFEEVAFGLQNLGVPRPVLLKRVEEALSLLELEHVKLRNPFDLSGGQVQRVALAGVLAMQPALLVLDEPTSQLDPAGSEEVFRVVERLARTGMTIVMAEQKMEKLAAYCDKILLLHQGRQIDFDTPSRIFARPDLKRYGIEAPVCTLVCRKLNLTLCPGESASEQAVAAEAGARYPVTLEETLLLKERFPKEADLLPKVKIPAPNAFHPLHDGTLPNCTFPDQDSTAKPTADLNGTQGTASPLLEAQNLSFSYKSGQPVFHGLTLQFDTRPTAIVGQNGAGKTTLAKLLKGLLRPRAGHLFLRGRDISHADAASLAGQIGYVFQNPDDQIFKSRVLDEVAFGPRQLGLSAKAAGEQAQKALDALQLSQLAKENPYDLELADRKLVALASVLAMDPQVLILDEPTIAQDAAGRARIAGVIQRFAAEKKLVISILHDMDFVAAHFARVLVMAGGKVLADGAPEMVFYEQKALKAAKLAPPQMTALCTALGYQGRYLTAEDMSLRGDMEEQSWKSV